MTHKIFVALSTFIELDRRPLELLESAGHPLRIHAIGKGKRITVEQLLRDGHDATVIVAGVESYDAGILEQLPALRCISRCGVGVDAIDLEAAVRRRIAVANTPHIPTQAVAEMALTYFLALSRDLRRQSNLMASGSWERLSAHLLSGRTVGVIGLGRIGQRVAELCRTFGARVIAHDPMGNAGVARGLGVALVPMDELLRGADIVSLHASKAPGAAFLIGAPEFAVMKSGVLFVNLARGGMIDEDALVQCLRSGHVGGAALDVFAEEPYRGPLANLDNVILTPHNSTLTVETRSEMELQAVENALAFIAGEIPPAHRVI